jgi:hypothetical protein
MGVTQAVFDDFNEIVVETAGALGVNSTDQARILALLVCSLNSVPWIHWVAKFEFSHCVSTFSV